MKRVYLVLVVSLVLHLLLLLQLQFTAWPEMVSFPYFISHGFVLYKDAIHAYPPLLVSCLAVIYKIFGYRLIALEIFGWVTILICDLFIFLILKKLINDRRLVVGGVIMYVILQPILEGNMVWPDLFMIPFLLATIFLILKKKYFYSGVAIGLALLTKQTAVFYLACCIAYIVFNTKSYKNLISFLVGSVIVSIPLLAMLVKQNSVQDFLNWTIIYPSTFWTKFPGYVNLDLSLRNSLSLVVLFLPIAILMAKSFRQKVVGQEFYLLGIFLIAGVVGVYPRFSFFHLQPALAFFVLLFVYLFSKVKISLHYLLFIPVLILIVNFKSLQFGEARFWTQSDTRLAKEIQNKTPNGESIYLLGLNSNLYALSDRLPSKPWLDNFGWYLEISGVQEKVIKGFEVDKPLKIFWRTPDVGNWYDLGVYQPKEITDFITANYNRKNEVEKGIVEWSRK